MSPPTSLRQLVADLLSPDSATVLETPVGLAAPARRKKLWEL